MNTKQKKILIRILLSSALIIMASLPFFADSSYFSLWIYAASYLIIGYDILIKAAKNIYNRQLLDENFLMAIATVCAFLIKEYPEATAVMLFYQIGELFQSIAVGKSRKSIQDLMDICPDSATVIRDGKEMTISPDDVSIGETIIVKPGEKIPLDCVIAEGFTSINTAALTGESLPVEKGVGDDIISGTVNLNGVIKATVKSEFSESTVSKILELVENASQKKSKSENFITRFAHFYTPAVVFSALALAILPPLILSQEFSKWVYRALVFLVVSCPCALVVSVPLSFFGGIGAASKKGILIKGSAYLEKMSNVKTVIFDKTGTLTEGKFSVSKIYSENCDETEMIRLSSLAESMSLHPIARSIVQYSGITPDQNKVKNLNEVSGFGITALVDGIDIAVGNYKLMDKINVSYKSPNEAGTCIHVAIDGKYAGYILVSDKIKSTSPKALELLKKSGVKTTVMLTGDNSSIAESVGNKLSIDQIFSGLLPNDKVTITEKIILQQPKGEQTAFVGDGINDAPVLARADVGIAMGAMGSDAAIEAADIVLMDDDISKISKAVAISRKTMLIVKENIVFSIVVKIGVLILGSLGFANMWFAIFADVGVMVLAILNSIRALNIK